MPRGRPKGSKNKNNTNNLPTVKPVDITVVDVKPEPVEKVKQENKYYSKCDLCSNEIHCSPCMIYLDQLTGSASYKRRCSINRAKICTKCAEELNKMIDSFIIKKNPSYDKWNGIEMN